MSIANYFTFARLLLSPLFLLVYLKYEALGITPTALPYVLFILLSILELSDAFDGYIARKYNQVTDLGKILDPMADSILRITVFLAFTQDPVNLPIFLVFIFLYRDSMISMLRTLCALKGFALAASMKGKIKSIMQAFAAFTIILLMIPHSLGMLDTSTFELLSLWIVSIAAAYSVYSGIDYFVNHRSTIAKML